MVPVIVVRLHTRYYKCIIAHQYRKRNLYLHAPLKAGGTRLKPLRIIEIHWEPGQWCTIFANRFSFGDTLECTVAT